ncbi:MAG: hypothetical protein QM820_35410 [Minicystis sp.]
MASRSMRFALALLLVPAAACSSALPPERPAPPAPAVEHAVAAETAAASPAPTATPAPSAAPAHGPPSCPKELITEVVGTPVWRLPNSTAFGFRTGMKIHAAGAPMAYHPDDSKAIDDLAKAGRPGQWTGLVTDNGKPSGKPLIQGRGDPAPGYYVSSTALFDRNKPARSPKRYIDASKIPYVALPEQAKEWGAELGDLAVVMNAKNGRIAFAIFADFSPPAKLGEGFDGARRRHQHRPEPEGRRRAGGRRLRGLPQVGQGRAAIDRGDRSRG